MRYLNFKVKNPPFFENYPEGLSYMAVLPEVIGAILVSCYIYISFFGLTVGLNKKFWKNNDDDNDVIMMMMITSTAYDNDDNDDDNDDDDY